MVSRRVGWIVRLYPPGGDHKEAPRASVQKVMSWFGGSGQRAPPPALGSEGSGSRWVRCLAVYLDRLLPGSLSTMLGGESGWNSYGAEALLSRTLPAPPRRLGLTVAWVCTVFSLSRAGEPRTTRTRRRA